MSNDNERRLAQIIASNDVFGIGNFSWGFRDYFNEFCDFVWNTLRYIIFFPHSAEQEEKQIIANYEKEHNAKTILNEIANMKECDETAWKQILFQNEVLKEVFENTKKVEQLLHSSNAYADFVKYTSGNCWINCKLSNNIALTDANQQMVNSINALVENVKGLTKSVVLFHGFEKLTDYGMSPKPFIDDIINVKGFLSKSLSLDIAKSFASSCNWLCPRILVVIYPEGSKHIFPTHRIQNTELEFLTHSNEKLIITKIVTYHEYPKYFTYFICEPVVENVGVDDN
jgi:hypothetical protein